VRTLLQLVMKNSSRTGVQLPIKHGMVQIPVLHGYYIKVTTFNQSPLRPPAFRIETCPPVLHFTLALAILSLTIRQIVNGQKSDSQSLRRFPVLATST
jgi:hypothetical protein